jgi:flagellar hook assembly protein FlgD
MLDLPAAAERADVSVYDVAGRRVAILHTGALDAGVHRLTWSGPGAGATGTHPGAGIYFVRAMVDGQGLRSRIVVAR